MILKACPCLHRNLAVSGMSKHKLTHYILKQVENYGDLVYKLKMIVGSNNFSAQFFKIISHYEKIGYNINNLMYCTDCMFGGQSNHGLQLCFPL